MARATKTTDAFSQAVERALEHCADPDWLGSQSPLAAPYYLGRAQDSQPGADSPAGRGRALQAALHKAAERLTPDQRRLLDASFFRRDPNLNNAGVALALHASEATYYRHRVRAIEDLATALNQDTQPPLRHELPRARVAVGRAALLAASYEALRSGQAVALTGGSGFGKSTLGAALVQRWEPGRAFWFTVRPGLNDDFSSLVFALAYFLRGLGASSTWRQIVADHGALEVPRMLGLLRHDLGALAEQPPLLCVDDADLLRPEWSEHAQMLHLIEEARPLAPVLVMGQRQAVAADQHHALSGLSDEEAAGLLAVLGAEPLSDAQHRQLAAAARGNPALIVFFAALLRAGEPAGDALAQLSRAPTVEALLDRIWRRLSPQARGLAQALAVFRGPAPQDAWPGEAATLALLADCELALLDSGGGVLLSPHAREYVYDRTPADRRTELHLEAAETRAARGEYTSAAYHYIAGRQPALAVWTWLDHREQEIERGRAAQARELFKEVAFGDLGHAEDRRALAILRGEQLLAAGQGEEAQQALEAAAWPAAHPAASYAGQLRGDALSLQGRHEQALASYRSAWQAVSGLPQRRRVMLRAKAGYVYAFRLRDLDQARREAMWGRFEAEAFQGNVEEEAGHYDAARRHYEAALDIARQLDNSLPAQSRTHSHLGHLTWRQGDTAAAIAHLETAIRISRQVGETVSVIYDQLNLSAAHILAGRHEQALEQAAAGLTTAEELRLADLAAGLASNAGEACYYLGRYDEAEQYALRSLREEEAIHRPYALTVLGLALQARGRLEQAKAALREAIASAASIHDRYAEAAAWRALAAALRARGDHAGAAGAAGQAGRLYDELGLAAEAEAARRAASSAA